MQAMILAAGFGTRLWPLTADRTKPAIPVLDRPLISYSVSYLRDAGIRDLIVNLHYQGESVVRALGDGERFGCRIVYSHEEGLILGTSGALDHARRFFKPETFVVMNGKVVTSIDLAAAIETHRRNKALATLVLRPNPARERFSTVHLDERGWITGFGGHPTADTPGEPLMFTGIQILEPEIFDFIPRGVFSHSTTDVYPKAIAAGRPVIAHVSRGANEDWHEFSTLRRYLDLSLRLAEREGVARIQGAGCEISPDATVERSVVWERVRIEPGATVRDAVIGDDVTVPAGACWENVVAVRADRVPPDPEGRGELVGDTLIVGM